MLVPRDDAAELMGGLPPGVEADVWDGGGALPPTAAEVEFYVPPFLAAGPAVEALAQLPALHVVQLLTAGAEAVLPHVPDGVTLCTARGAHDAATAEWVIAAMLAVLRDLPAFVGAQREGRWDSHPTDVLAEKTVLLLGYGAIGAAVERRLAGFEVEIVRVARSARDGVSSFADLPGLLPRADVVVVLVPMTEETRGLVGASFLAALPDHAVLVNAARGPVVDTGALVAELRTGRLRAALDVTDPEPLPAGHPLWASPGLVLTPHVAGSTPLAAPRAFRIAGEQLRRYVAGEPLHNVVGDRGY